MKYNLTFRSVVYSPDGRLVVTGGQDNVVRFWDASLGHEVLTLTGHSGPVVSLAFTPDGATLVSLAVKQDSQAEVLYWKAAKTD